MKIERKKQVLKMLLDEVPEMLKIFDEFHGIGFTTFLIDKVNKYFAAMDRDKKKKVFTLLICLEI
jgi:hypothetical protein